MRKPFLFILLFALLGCKTDKKVNIHELTAFDGEYINVVVEIPAGTNHKMEYNYATGVFENDQKDGKDRIVSFLPYPGNYGFIPSTLMDKTKGGDGDALDVLVLGESLPTGSVQKVKAIGALLLKDDGKIDTKIIAIPVKNPVLAVDDFLDFAIRYDAARRIIEDWFMNYKGQGVMELIRWEDEQYAKQEIERWLVD